MSDSESECKRETSKKYKTRPGPPYPAGPCAGSVARGNDNHYYISKADSKGVHRWVKKGAAATRKPGQNAIYVTLDNGNLPFVVIDDGGSLDVYRQTFDESTEMFVRGKHVYSGAYDKLWVGKDPLGITYEWDQSYMLGNSLLAQTGKNTYVHIGERIFSFSLMDGDSVVTYSSPVGNNDVPYPYVIGKTHTYLLLDGGGDIGPKVIPNDILDLKLDAYSQFYGHPSAPKGRELVPLPKKKPAVSSYAKPLKRKLIAQRIW